MAFQSRPLNPSPLVARVRRHPFLLFGLPFLSITVLSSFALTVFTRTRYDLHASRHSQMTQEEELGMRKDRKRLNLREEYFRLTSGLDPTLASLSSSDSSSPDYNRSLALPSSSVDSPAAPSASTSTTDSPARSKRTRDSKRFAPVSQDDLEIVRVPRLPGMPEWGGGMGGEEAPLKGQRKEDRWV